MVDERGAQRMAYKRGSLELERIQNIPEMLEERVYRVFIGCNRLVRQPVSLEIDGDHPKPAIGKDGHVAPEYINRAAPPVNEHDRRRGRIATLHHSHFQAGVQSREAHAISRIAGGKHFARTEIVPAM